MRKLLQMKMYSFLSSRWGMTFCVVGLFVTLNAFFQIIQLLIARESATTVAFDYSNNVGGKPMQHIMCDEPIDIVYTWVNGSDPRHKKTLADYKRLIRDPNMKQCNSTQTPDKDHCYVEEDTASRFIDNEELRYSLRSIEAFAPWVHHIYLVTNGQVPSWLNTEHPRLSVISHSQIFPNKSHLPTFSSPSIEVNLHRIPGLSKKFIYLNDDVMFGREVYPDDFYTKNAGQKVFLSWAVPNCAEGCPPNWVGDGYCDLACNVSACDFDAHDCDNYTAPSSAYTSGNNNRWWQGGNAATGGGQDTTQRYKNYCSKGCPDSWIGDKYCDRMCKNLECAFDAGDCGVEDIFGSMHGVQITWNTTVIPLQSGLPSVYFNLTDIVGTATITDGSHDNAELVRTATISQKFKIMTLTFHRNISFQEVMLSITAENTTESGNKTIIEKSFNITLDTLIAPPNDTASPASNAANPSTEQQAGGQSQQTQQDTQQTQQTQQDTQQTQQTQQDTQQTQQQTQQQAETQQTQQEPQQTQETQQTQQEPPVQAVALEPAQQPPNDAAIEQQIQNGSGGLQQQEPPASHTKDAAESVVPMDQQPQQPAPNVQAQAAAIGESNVVPPDTPVSPVAEQPQQNNVAQSEPENIAQSEPENNVVQSEPEKQHTEVDVVADQIQSELALQGQPEARQTPEEDNNEPQQEVQKRSEQPPNPDDQTQTDLQQAALEPELDQGNLEAVQLNPGQTQTAGSNKAAENGGKEGEQEQKFVLKSENADNTGALDPNAETVITPVQDDNNKKDAVGNQQFAANVVDRDTEKYRQTEYEDDKQKGEEKEFDTQDQTHVTKDTKSTSIRFKHKGTGKGPNTNNDELDFTELDLPESANNQQQPPAGAQTRDILSITIYDDANGESVSTVDTSRYHEPTPKPNNNNNNNNAMNSVEYKKWWDSMTQKKQQDIQQMAESKREMEEIEQKLKQNRDLEKQLAEEGSSLEGTKFKFPWEVYEMKGGGRRLLDDFADSLKFVNKLYTKEFGPASRKVPAHMPHMIDRDVMEELQQKWPDLWDATASHRLRHPQDMQYAFSYFYYLIHARVEYNFTQVWETELDKDHDGELSNNELRTLGVHLHGAPLKQASFNELKEKLLNTCLTLKQSDPAWTQQQEARRQAQESEENNNNEVIEREDRSRSTASRKQQLPHCPITIEVIQNDNKTSDDIKKLFSKRLKYKHQIEGTDEVAFLMIGGNDTVVQGKLDGIRTKRQKFVCLNDNMNHSSPDAELVVNVLHDLYIALVPLPSTFELPPNVRNAFLYIEEINEAKAAAHRQRQYQMAVGVVAILVLVCMVIQCRKYASRSDRRVRERRARRLLNSGGIS